MRFKELSDPKYVKYLDISKSGKRFCKVNKTPKNVLEKFKEINEQYKKYLGIKNFIMFI